MQRQAITAAFLLQVKNVLVKMVVKGASAHGHLSSKPESEKSQRRYVLSRDPKVFSCWGFPCGQRYPLGFFVSTHTDIQSPDSQKRKMFIFANIFPKRNALNEKQLMYNKKIKYTAVLCMSEINT